MTKYVLATLVLATATASAATTFPPITAFTPLRCGGQPMTDPFGDDAADPGVRDVVGDSSTPVALRAADDQLLYLRMRVDEDPRPGGMLDAYSWGMEFDLDGDLSTYELLILVDGTGGPAGKISVFTNHTTTLANDGNDPADTPAVTTYMFADNGQTGVAPCSNFGGTPDYFIDFAIPWTALQPLGLDHDTPTHVWVASSSSADSLNGDFACEDARSGAVHLDTSGSDPTTGDPADEMTGPTGALRLEGGGGCNAGGGAPAPCLLLALLALRRRRR